MNSSTERLCRWHVRDREDGIVDDGGRKIRLGSGSDLPEDLVRSLRSVLGTDAEPVISAFTDSLKSPDDKLRLTAATTITNAVVKISGSSPGRSTGLPTRQEVEAATMKELVPMIYAFSLEAVERAGRTSAREWGREDARQYLREHMTADGVELFREAFGI